MLDIAWPEVLVIGAVALIVIGPKDMPKVMRAAGRWAGKAQRLVRELGRHMQQLEYESRIAEDLRAREDKQATEAEKSPPPARDDAYDRDHKP